MGWLNTHLWIGLSVMVLNIAFGPGTQGQDGMMAKKRMESGPTAGGIPDNSRDLCLRDMPDTFASKRPGDNGFRIKLSGNHAPDKYTAGQVYTVSLNGTYPDQRLLGFMLVAVTANAQDETNAMGTFQHFPTGLTKNAEMCPHVIMHTYKHPRPGAEVLWTAPPEGTGCVEFRASVMEYDDIWYKDDGALTRTFCEETAHTEAVGHEMIPDCCACGTGKYQMTFHGLWSRQSHPKEWPNNKRLLHWSNIVGASHSKDYMLWEYGGYASKGIKEVCEFGYPRTLEQEMRRHSLDVRTVIKTPGIWWSKPDGLRQSRWARFSVDRTSHMLSMLTMLGPSPDWCVGVSGLDLCLPNCTWAGDLEVELYPWDAGTDDGITYMARNQKSEPQQKIQHITNEWPDSDASPFHNSNPLRPLAMLSIRRIHPKPGVQDACTENGTDSEVEEVGDDLDLDLHGGGQETGELTDMEKKKLMMMNGEKCAMSEYSEWSECSVTCGRGQRFRKRMYLHPMGGPEMCGENTMDTEDCIGIENQCETIEDECAMTGWSDWSPCSATCSKGIRERRRYYLRPMDEKVCSRQAATQEMCVADEMDCAIVVGDKNFTAICSLTMDVGPCRGFFMRWYYDAGMTKCVKFPYGGCRGNNNRFRSLEECTQMCVEHMQSVVDDGTNRDQERSEDEIKEAMVLKRKMMQKNRRRNSNNDVDIQGDLQLEPVDCMVTEWTEWSDCSATCDDSVKRRQRMIKREPENGGRKCPKKLNKTKKCKVPKCSEAHDTASGPLDCQVTAWSSWSVCSSTCGRGYRYKRRTITRSASRGGQECPAKLERKRSCDLPACSIDCALGEWGNWSPCGKTCGEDSIQERSRQIVNRPRRGGAPCEPRLERRFCMLPRCPNSSASLSEEEQMNRLLDVS